MQNFLYVALYLIRIIEMILIARCIISFIPNIRDSQAAKFVYWLTEPVLAPARKLISKAMPNSQLPFDITLIATYLALIIIRMFIQSII